MIKDTESYRQGFIAGLDIKENYKTIIFGFELNEILDILEQHLKDKIKIPTKPIMTREEAIALIRNVFGITDTGQGIKWIDFFIDAGMLDVRKEENSFAYAIQQHNLVPKNIPISSINDILAAISAMGYEIKAI